MSDLLFKLVQAWPQVTVCLLAGALLLMTYLSVWGGVPVTYNLRNLIVRRWTTLMTALAFTLVIGLLTAMLAFVNGMYSITRSSGHKDNLMILGQSVQDEVFSSLAFNDTGDIETQSGIARTADGAPLVSKETYLNVNQPVDPPRPGSPKRRFLQVRGLDDPTISLAVHGVELFPNGRPFTAAGSQARSDNKDERSPLIEVMLGEGIARALGRDRETPAPLELGDTFRLGSRECVVVGILRSTGLTCDSEIWAKRDIMAKTFGKTSYTTLVLRAESEQEAVLLKRFFAQAYKKASVEPVLETEYFDKLNGNNRQFLVAIIFVAIVLAVGGIFGVMNTMYAAVAQRIKDIGVLRLVGFSRSAILGSFVLESLLIALLGGGLGCALGSLAHGQTVSAVMGTGQGGGKGVVFKMVVDLLVIGQGLLLSVLMGALGGLMPAITAVRLRALDALR